LQIQRCIVLAHCPCFISTFNLFNRTGKRDEGIDGERSAGVLWKKKGLKLNYVDVGL
jgi:hypothetical protein